MMIQYHFHVFQHDSSPHHVDVDVVVSHLSTHQIHVLLVIDIMMLPYADVRVRHDAWVMYWIRVMDVDGMMVREY